MAPADRTGGGSRAS
ncbi:hypothetical protein ACLQ22_21610, partial [Micromonospora sp. DT178]